VELNLSRNTDCRFIKALISSRTSRRCISRRPWASLSESTYLQGHLATTTMRRFCFTGRDSGRAKRLASKRWCLGCLVLGERKETWSLPYPGALAQLRGGRSIPERLFDSWFSSRSLSMSRVASVIYQYNSSPLLPLQTQPHLSRQCLSSQKMTLSPSFSKRTTTTSSMTYSSNPTLWQDSTKRLGSHIVESCWTIYLTMDRRPLGEEDGRVIIPRQID
jgi:hypothetical protein